VGGRILPPRKIFDVRPQYPPNLRGASVDGRVVLEARIGTDGFVKDVRTASADDPDLDGAARDAVGQWRFTPTLLNCTPVEVSMMVRVYFKPE
jgi:TonB family protein